MLFREEDEDQELLPFQDRADAGRILASRLSAYSSRDDVVVVGLARGGVAVAFQVAQALQVSLDVLVVRKLGTPWSKELAMGAIATDGMRVLDLSMVKDLCVADEAIKDVADAELQELQRREQLYRHHRPALPVAGKTVILVDDGIATGSSILAAIGALRRRHAARVVVATPVAAVSSCNTIRMEADEMVCVAEPGFLLAISQCDEDFSEAGDDDVGALLEEANRAMPRAA